ncbi:hypothetical protein FFA43_07220 [Campylobacter hyointestinalis subsp. hyointestinalis]|uniref:PP-loop family protein n=1 Tax=Campylobacter hyointestinalis subsp. hyointestinalis TaxID=91352 RepID=A0A9W5EW54_CAMHY|nr:flagellar export protein FliJ [Campylobacter hyointestinalis]PPB58366.1 hypothetical protein CDQ71_05550 [Campylobacter hyointestinalis subsp. hyointestinalis]PPB68259.1 hypothetical protein CDQ76_03820 [Campylobacter hyointestinalis subsp. hyointestinalis]QCU00425.1 hypothetical protein FFA43_07220 [Campylobacter hyointestinalis subsp. hyointestinalis]TWO22178.1 hypothetical protein YZ80_01845 [Campylobacter hyointestinalis]CUU68367.1 PP-loop family protein [Campylobacter hyointestinalis s
MNTKFSQVIKLKKQNLDKIEICLAKCRTLRSQLEDLLKKATLELGSYKFPKGGNFIVMKSSLEEQRLLREHKDDLMEKLNLNQKEIMHYELQYKKAYMEFEKIRYLEQEEIKKILEKAKKDEAIMLDEIAIQRYSFIKAN